MQYPPRDDSWLSMQYWPRLQVRMPSTELLYSEGSSVGSHSLPGTFCSCRLLPVNCAEWEPDSRFLALLPRMPSPWAGFTPGCWPLVDWILPVFFPLLMLLVGPDERERLNCASEDEEAHSCTIDWTGRVWRRHKAASARRMLIVSTRLEQRILAGMVGRSAVQQELETGLCQFAG